MTRSRDAENPREGGFASRWSQRKRAARAGVLEPETVPEPQAAPQAQAAEATPDDRPDDEILAELNLPDPDQMKPGDDFSAFMAKAVPAHTRQRALRRLWISDPVYANLDGLVDYAEDFTDAATVIPGMKTLYEVGKGFAERFAGAGDEAESPPGPAPDFATESAASAESTEPPQAAPQEDSGGLPGAVPPPREETPENAGIPQAEPAPAAPDRRPRRMQFRLAED